MKVFVLACLTGLGIGSAAAAQCSWQQPNFVLLVAEDLGREWLGCYGGEEVRTAQIDRLAANGAVFRTCYAAPMPSISRVELLTGRYPFRTGWMWENHVPSQGPPVLEAAREKTFAQILQEVGYRTAFAGVWGLNRLGDDEIALRMHGFDQCEVTEDANAIEAFVNDFVEGAAGSPFAVCAFLAAAKDSGRFKQHVLSLDAMVGRIVATVHELDLDRRTIVLLTSTCGTDGLVAQAWGNRSVRGGRGTLLEVGINVPLIVSGSYWVERGQQPDELVDFTDVLPTLADLAGGRLPKDREIDGRSLGDVLCGRGTRNPREWIFAQHGGERVVRNARYKLDTKGRFHDALADPLEQQNLGRSANSEVVAERERLGAVLRSLPPDRPLNFPYARRIIVRRRR